LIAGQASGAVLHASTGLGCMGGVEVATGRIIDGHHPLRGRSVAGRIPAILSGLGPDPADFGISAVPHPGHHPRNRDR